MRTEAMHVVAESGVAAHRLYKASQPEGDAADRLGTKWLQSLLDIQHETRDAAEFWDHVKIDLFPDAVYVFTPRSQIMALPRGATVVDFAYAIHSNVGDQTIAAKINGVQVPLRTELKNGDVVEVVTAPVSTPNPAWLGFVRTGRARSKIRHHLKTLAQVESQALGQKLLTQALRAEGADTRVMSQRLALLRSTKPTEDETIVLTSLDVTETRAMELQLRQLRRRYPKARIGVALWPGESDVILSDDNQSKIRIIGADFVSQGMGELLSACFEHKVQTAKAGSATTEVAKIGDAAVQV